MSSKPSSPIIFFMSADIVGATSYKVRNPADERSLGWLDALETFFRLTPLRFVGRLAEEFSAEPVLPDSSVWKVLGDEIVFVCMPRTREEVLHVSKAFLRTIHDCNETIMAPFGLSVRGCCWAAQLTGRNRAVHIPEMAASYLDYLGPDVDTGFRISAFAGGAEVAFSFNLIATLAQIQPEPELLFEMRGSQVLKGVTMQEPYPILVCPVRNAFVRHTGDDLGDQTSQAVGLHLPSAIVTEVIRGHTRPALLQAGSIEFS